MGTRTENILGTIKGLMSVQEQNGSTDTKDWIEAAENYAAGDPHTQVMYLETERGEFEDSPEVVAAIDKAIDHVKKGW